MYIILSVLQYHYKGKHCLLLLSIGSWDIAALTASSKISLMPFRVLAEHSMYLTAPMLLAIADP